MYIKSLLIRDDQRVIRDIRFRRNLNLIVDETSSDLRTDSGNNVGKTTVLRLIDYCLGSDGKNIWTDPEFKQTNKLVETFLKERSIFVELVLSDDLDLADSREIHIIRNFQARSQKVIKVNGEEVKSKDFPEMLKPLVFGTNQSKPTFRQIIAKNIRDDRDRLQNTLRVLHTTSRKEEYEALYLYWLGIDLDVSDRKQRLYTSKKIETDLQRRLRKEHSKNQIEQSLIYIDLRIKDLEEQREKLVLNSNYEDDLEELDSIKREIGRLGTRISRLEVRLALIEESEEELKKELVEIDVNKIRDLYEEANRYIPNLQKTYEETLAFHNGMVKEKLDYLKSEVPELQSELTELRSELKALLESEESMTYDLRKMGTLDDLQRLISVLSEAHENRGLLEEQLRLWESSDKSLRDIDEELRKIDEGIDSQDDLIRSRLTVFNKLFTDLSEKLCDETYILSADKGERGYEMTIASLIGNPGTGRKKTEMIAFDVAYIQFADEVGLSNLHFVLQDEIENVHDNQISTILLNIVEGSNVQLILPVLRDKLPRSINVEGFEVLSLSQSNKLLRI